MDEVMKSEFHYQEHTGTLTHKLTQPSEKQILERAQDLRRSKGVLHDLGAQGNGGSWGRMVASVPLIVYEQAKRDGYDLDCLDAQIAGQEMNRFLQSTEGRMCLVQG